MVAEEEEKEETSQESSPRHSAFGGDDTDTDGEEDGVRPRGICSGSSFNLYQTAKFQTLPK